MLWFTICACTSKFHSCIAIQKFSWQTDCYLPACLIMTDSLMWLTDWLAEMTAHDWLPACMTTDWLADLPDSLTDLYLWLWLTYWQTDWLIYTCNWVWLTDLLIDLLTLLTQWTPYWFNWLWLTDWLIWPDSLNDKLTNWLIKVPKDTVTENVFSLSDKFLVIKLVNYTVTSLMLFLSFSREEASQLIQRKRVQVHGNGRSSVMHWFRLLGSLCSWMWTDCGIHLLWRKNLSSMLAEILQRSNLSICTFPRNCFW